MFARRVCERCGKQLSFADPQRRFCSNACKQADYRARRKAASAG